MTQRLGLVVHTSDRLGVDVEFDLKRLCGKQPANTIFDVGANVGQTAMMLHHHFPKARIFSFEPVPQTFAELRRNTSKISEISIFNQAMGDMTGSAPMHLADASVRNSFVPSSVSSTGTIQVPVTTIAEFCQIRNIEQIDLLKVDVEGFEPQVLRGASSMLRNGQVRFLYLESNFAPFPEMPQSSFFELVKLLFPLGYCVAGVYAESFRLKSGSLFCNILFAHTASLPPSVDGAVQNIFQ